MVDNNGVDPQDLQGEILELIGPDDEIIKYEILEFVSLSDQDYVICALVDGPEDEAYAFRMIQEGDQGYLQEISDEEEWQKVAEAWGEYEE